MRSINTSFTSLLPVGVLLFVGFASIGAETLLQFALALFIGIAVGTYSSLFVASPLLGIWKEREPEWERRRRRSEKTEDEPVASPQTNPTPGETATTVIPTARPPKQRKKRR